MAAGDARLATTQRKSRLRNMNASSEADATVQVRVARRLVPGGQGRRRVHMEVDKNDAEQDRGEDLGAAEHDNDREFPSGGHGRHRRLGAQEPRPLLIGRAFSLPLPLGGAGEEEGDARDRKQRNGKQDTQNFR